MTNNIYKNLHPLSLGLHEILQKDGIEISLYKISRVANLLESLRDDNFNSFSSGTKKMLIESVLDLKGDFELKGLNKITEALFDTHGAGNKKKSNYPSLLMIHLVKVLRKERSEDIKACILKIFLKKEDMVPTYLNLEDIVFSLFSNDSLFRHRMILCMTNYFSQSDVIFILTQMMKKADGKIPGNVLNTIIAAGDLNDSLEKKRELLFPANQAPPLNIADIERLWEEYLHSLNRFGLIRTVSLNSWQSLWKISFEKEAAQLSLNFKKSNMTDNSAFSQRIQAIKGY